MPAPRSDYFCSRCEKTHADLPIGTDACPDCHKRKWFTRVWAVNVSTTGIAQRKEPQLQAAIEAARAPGEAAKAAQRQGRIAPSFGVPMAQAQAMTGLALRSGDSSYKRQEIAPPSRDTVAGQLYGRKPPKPMIAGSWEPKKGA